jgi:hypothetical protein
MTLDFESDQQVIDNLEAITYTSVATAGNTTIDVPDAAFYWQNLQEAAPSAGVYTRADGIFVVRDSLLACVGGAKPADTITRDDGSVWTVLSVRPPVISGVWQLTCRDLILANGLQQTGTLSRPALTQDSAGRQALSSYTTVASNIACRVQPEGGDAGNALDRRTLPQRLTAFLGVQVTAQAKDLFAVDGQNYTVLDFKMPHRIDELMTLSLELIG